MENKSIERKAGYLLKIIGFMIMYTIVQKLFILINDETLIQNWAIGLIGMVAFFVFYIVDNGFILFRIDKINEFFILFFLSWLLADLTDFLLIIQTIFTI